VAFFDIFYNNQSNISIKIDFTGLISIIDTYLSDSLTNDLEFKLLIFIPLHVSNNT